MSARNTVFCSSCGVENLAGARFCSACGAAMLVVTAPTAKTAPITTTAPAAAPITAAASPTIVREGIVGTGLQRFAYLAASLAGIAALFAVFLGIPHVGGLEWGTRPDGFALPAPLYVVGMIIVIILNPLVFRMVHPRQRDVGRAAVRSYRRTLRQRDGIRLLLNPSGLKAGIVIEALLWVGLGALAYYNLGNLQDQGFDVAVGLYACLAIPIVGVIGAACLWPVSPDIVYMDRAGVITRG